MTLLGRVIAVALILILIGYIERCRYQECRKVGHSVLYCIEGRR